MSGLGAEKGSSWSLILAGGDGERTRAFVENWLGYHKPKQYCNFVGRRSMFQHTVDRADRVASAEHRFTVIAKGHRNEIQRQLKERRRGTILVQPRKRGTAAGVFLPLTYLRTRAPEASVTIFPSDHFVYPEEALLTAVKRATALTEAMPDHVILQGVDPDGPESDYGWIEPGPLSGGARAVRRFVEKPSPAEADRARARGAVWNTLVVTGKVNAFWRMGWRSFPDAMELFERWSRAVGSTEETAELESIYRVMPVRDFSADLLARCCGELRVLSLSDVLWSGWDRPERIVETLRSLGREPAFDTAPSKEKVSDVAMCKREVIREREKIEAREEVHYETGTRCRPR